MSALNQQVADINNDVIPEDEDFNMFQRDDEPLNADTMVNKQPQKNLLEPSEEPSMDSVIPQPNKGLTKLAPKVYMVSENSDNVVRAQKSPSKIKTSQNQLTTIQQEATLMQTEGTEEVMIIEESEEEVTVADDDTVPFQPFSPERKQPHETMQ